ncbi:alpha/beta hydrolase [Paenibacillus thiaminolyticus]|uniref:alpha/beta hydrolase n=1 Tax=Paenibacillus thiaminolyticus TaxID=49283 RepID=UPI00232D8446|nr:alpha/beta hydrolase [Paenibacillus thiaminolyticus]WCF06519.1 alpha/beta hydrolase [Paenibacillus thiaminolyticus]
MWIYVAAGCVLLIVIVSANLLGSHVFRRMTLGRRSLPEEACAKAFAMVEGMGLMSRAEFEALPKEEASILSKDGFRLRGYYIEPNPGGRKVVIIVHGYTANHGFSSQFIPLFADEGFNVLLIDQRSHGRSEGRYATYGFYEREDLDAWIEWVRHRVGEDAYIGLHGQSMGGGTVLMHAGTDPGIRFIIADCPYSDLEKLMRYQLKDLNRVPIFPFMGMLERRLRRRAAFSMRDVKPVERIREQEVPLLLIHGGKDDFVPTSMSVELYHAKTKGIRRLHIVDDAVHAGAYPTDPEGYREAVREFLAEVREQERHERLSESSAAVEG